ncbi:MAG: hypothetical protein H6Q33_677 [Deltaproteobacteria bacterium]|nr:hypothetical protein [Deltaproteobacteria bacterium]
MSTLRSSIHPTCGGLTGLPDPRRISSDALHRERNSTQPQPHAASQPSRATQARKRLRAIAERLGRDDLAVLTLIAERLRLGRRACGGLRLTTDRRDFTHEALEEAADMAVYAAAG